VVDLIGYFVQSPQHSQANPIRLAQAARQMDEYGMVFVIVTAFPRFRLYLGVSQPQSFDHL
jgi:hypothetical protein